MKGRIKALVPGRGYGFITDESARDYFFHLSDVVGGDTLFRKPVGRWRVHGLAGLDAIAGVRR